MFDGNGPPALLVILIVLVVAAVIFTCALFLGMWINNKSKPAVPQTDVSLVSTSTSEGVEGVVAGRLVTVFNGKSTTLSNFLNNYLESIDEQSTTPGTALYMTYVNIDMRLKG